MTKKERKKTKRRKQKQKQKKQKHLKKKKKRMTEIRNERRKEGRMKKISQRKDRSDFTGNMKATSKAESLRIQVFPLYLASGKVRYTRCAPLHLPIDPQTGLPRTQVGRSAGKPNTPSPEAYLDSLIPGDV